MDSWLDGNGGIHGCLDNDDDDALYCLSKCIIFIVIVFAGRACWLGNGGGGVDDGDYYSCTR